MLTFAELVDREDIKRYIHHYQTVGSRLVGVANLDYFEPATIQRTVAETVLTVPLAPAKIRIAIAGAKRHSFAYQRGHFDLTPAGASYTSERDDAGPNLAISLPAQTVSDALADVAAPAGHDFGRLYDAPHVSPVVLALAEQLAREPDERNPMGPLYADEVARMIVLELYRCSGGESSAETKRRRRLPNDAMRKIDAHVDAHATENLGLEDLAELTGMSQSTLSKYFKETTGFTVYQYVLQRRLAKAQRLIRDTKLSLAQVAYDFGFSSQAHMNQVFRQKLGATPGQIRRR